MEFERLSIPDVILVRPRIFGDERGFFLESWEKRKFAAGGIAADFVQDNHSRSVRHTLRGLHYQVEQPQGKLVRVVAGAVFDVAVDLEAQAHLRSANGSVRNSRPRTGICCGCLPASRTGFS